MSIQNALNTSLYTRLSGTALTSLLAGGTASPSVFFEQAPDNATLPYVVWLFPSEYDNNIVSHRMKEIIVRAYGVAPAPAQAGTVDAAIDTLLNGQELSITGWTNIWLRRENGYQLITTSTSGVRYYTAGADYRATITNG